MGYQTDKPTIIAYSQLLADVKPKPSRKRSRPLVHFSLNNNTTTLLDNACPSSSMTDDERASTWYKQEELDSFRSEAHLSTLSSPAVQLLVKESMAKSRSMQLDEKEVLYQKRRRKHVAIQAVLEAQRRLKNLPLDKEQKLSDVSSQFSNWARDLARRVAVMDSFVNNDSDLNCDNNACKRQRLSAL